jgi:tRNA (guanine37-N1)-methyltransferase
MYLCDKKMRIDILTIFPEMFDGPFNNSIMKRATSKNIVEINIHNIRDFSLDKHKRVDDYAFSGEAGMVMQVEPIHRCIESLTKERCYDEIIFMTPDGERFSQSEANRLSSAENIIILCGHYKGVDQRVRDYLITKELSIGDYVITGGELAAAVVTDSIVRLIPGAITDIRSALSDSFQDNLLAPPVYSRPEEYNGWIVPEILLSGNDKKIDIWKMDQAIEKTKRLRPDLLVD